jgi:hypothetical protein
MAILRYKRHGDLRLKTGKVAFLGLKSRFGRAF